MAETISIPELGEGVDSVEVVSVLVSVGDTIVLDQPLIEVETEKASVEVPAPIAGVVKEIHLTEGDQVRSGAPIITIEATESLAQEKPETEPEISVVIPEQKPDTVSDTINLQQSTTEESSLEKLTSSPLPQTSDQTREVRKPAVAAAPSVRRFAREVGADIAKVQGSGPAGRISIDDVKEHVSKLLSSAANTQTSSAVSLELPDLERWGPVRREAMTKIRRLTAENLSRAWATIPQVTNHESADITDLEDFRQAYKDRVKAAGGKLTMTAIIVKVIAAALRAHPTLNASVDMAQGEIVFRESIHIGVAVDTERGLLVPVIRDADRKDLTQISIELDDLAVRAKSRKLKLDEMQGGSFSISNLGGIGGTGFTPIVNWPEVAILGISRGRIEPQWFEDNFRTRLLLPLSLSYDHRLVDGADAARFLRRVADLLEQPILLALEG